MRKLLILLLLAKALAQTPVGTTLVTATVTDAHGMPYVNGSFSVKLSPPSGTLLNAITGQLDSAGTLSVSLKPGSWVFTVCAHDNVTCFTSTEDVSGASQDFTGDFSAATVPYYTHTIDSAKIGRGGITFDDGSNQQTSGGIDYGAPQIFTGDFRSYGPVIFGQPGGGVGTPTLTWNGSTSGSNVWTVANTGGTVTATAPFAAPRFRNVPTTFALTAACSAGLEGSMAAITDSTTATWGATITGGSTNHVLGYCNGTNWTVAAK